MITVRLRAGVSFLAVLLALIPAAVLAQTGAGIHHRADRRRVGRRRAGRHRHGHQPGDQRRLRRGHQRIGQLHDPQRRTRHLRRQGGDDRVPHLGDRPAGRSRPGRSRASISRWGSGAVAETVSVVSVSPILQTETSTVGEVISGNTVQSLPLNGRNTGQLALLLPGHRDLQPARVHQHRRRQQQPSVRQRQPRADQQLHRRWPGRQRDRRQPRRVPAKPGRDRRDQRRDQQLRRRRRQRRRRVDQQRHQVGHEQVLAATRSSSTGTATSTRTRGRTTDPRAAKQERKQHIYGGTLGGPIVSNSLFFFADYQGSRQDAPGETLASVAPEAWRRGDLSSLTAQLRDPLTGLPFAGNQIPVERFSATARAILNDLANYPLPNRTVSGRHHRQLRRRHPARDPRAPGRRAARLEPVGEQQVLRPLLVRPLQGPPRRAALPAGPDDRQRPAVRQRRLQLEPRVRIVDGQRAAGRLQQHAR